jgi:hypothetical protein
MPKIGEMMSSKYLKKEDVGNGVLVTIAGVKKMNVAVEGADPEYKWAMSFREMDKPMVLNSTNIQLCAKACDSEDTDDWIGKVIVLYDDPNVSYAGKLTGGIRIRARRNAPKPEPVAPKPSAGSFSDMGDDIPFRQVGIGAEAYVI